MADTVSKQIRSRIMAAVPQRNTTPELVVRRCLHKLGFRYRLHDRRLPGSPDIVLPKYASIIFVHGCFWHQHPGCKKSKPPSSNTGYWDEKLRQNKIRDRRYNTLLRKLGWKIIVVWECETKNPIGLSEKLMSILLDAPTKSEAASKK